MENRWYKKKEFRRLLKAGLGDKLRKIREAAREKDEAAEQEKLMNKNDESDSRKKMPGRKEKADRIPSTTPGAEPPRDARDSGSARSHSTHLETSSSNRP